MATVRADAGAAAVDAKVYEHLGRVINRVVEEAPQDAYGLVEVLSRLIKEGDAATKAAPAPTEKELTDLSNSSTKARALMMPPIEPESDPPAIAEAAATIGDLCEEADMFAWAGAGFSELETYKVKCSIRALANKKRDALGKDYTLRFWGKMLGTEKDYYVVECNPHLPPEGDAPEQDPDDPDRQEEGGVNTFSYFVCTDLCGEWSSLPDLKPSHIKVARQIKKLMTGNLDAQVVTHPFFPGDEKVLLRAQIAQITSDTVLCVKGYLTKEDEEVKPAEEFVYPAAAQLKKMENWMHMQPYILKTGRTKYEDLPDEDDDNKDKIAQLKAEQEADPMQDPIRSLTVDGLKWVIKQAGDTTLYKNELRPKEDDDGQLVERPPKCYTATYVRSLTWPGAVTVAKGDQFANMYIGYGLMAGSPDFFLRAPPDVQDEPDDIEEQEEPQGQLEEPVKEDE